MNACTRQGLAPIHAPNLIFYLSMLPHLKRVYIFSTLSIRQGLVPSRAPNLIFYLSILPRLKRVYIFPTLSIRQGLAPSRTLYPAFMFIFAPALVVSIFFMFSYTRLGVHICSRPNFLFSNIIFIYFIFV